MEDKGVTLDDVTIVTKVVRESTGEVVEVRESARDALDEIDNKIYIYKELLLALKGQEGAS